MIEMEFERRKENLTHPYNPHYHLIVNASCGFLCFILLVALMIIYTTMSGNGKKGLKASDGNILFNNRKKGY